MIPMLSVGILLLLLSLLLYIFRDYLFWPGLLGLLFFAQALVRWYLSPRSLVIDNNCLNVHYRNRSISYSADEIAGIQAWMTEQGQFRSVVIAFHDQSVLDLSAFQQTPFITFPVLKQWHEENVKKQVPVF